MTTMTLTRLSGPDLTPSAPTEHDPQDVAAVVDAVRMLASVMPLNSRSFGDDPLDALLYALFVGWECEQHPDSPDCEEDLCGGSGAFDAVGDRFGWDEPAQARIRAMRAGIAALAGRR